MLSDSPEVTEQLTSGVELDQKSGIFPFKLLMKLDTLRYHSASKQVLFFQNQLNPTLLRVSAFQIRQLGLQALLLSKAISSQANFLI